MVLQLVSVESWPFKGDLVNPGTACIVVTVGVIMMSKMNVSAASKSWNYSSSINAHTYIYIDFVDAQEIMFYLPPKLFEHKFFTAGCVESLTNNF